MRLDGKIALVTGGCGGIGLATGERFLSEGAIVVLADRKDQSQRPEVQSAINGRRMVFKELDVTSEESWKALIADVTAEFGGLDILVNNAGVLLPRSVSIEETSFEEWKQVLSVNLDGVFLGIRTALPVMKGRPGASIVNIGSISAFMGSHDHGAYGTSKGAVRVLTRHAALSAAEKGGVRINAVHPGITYTNMIAEKFGRPFSDKQGTVDHYASLNPMQEMVHVSDIAAAVAFFASQDARMITGAELVVDGGMTLVYLKDKRPGRAA